MLPTVFQPPEIRDGNDNIVQQGAFGKNSPLSNSTNDGWIDYVANDLNFLYGIAKDEVVPVSALPASGDMNKTYLLTTTGKTYRWSGTAWVEISSSEAAGRAESAATLAEQWATKTNGTVDGSEYSAKHYANSAQQSADDAQDVADDMATHLAQIDQNTGGVSANSKRIGNIEKLLQGNLYDYDTDDDSAYVKNVPAGALPYAGIEKLGGRTIVMNQAAQSGNFADVSKWSVGIGHATLSATDNVLTVTITESSSTVRLSSSFSFPRNDHKYYVKGEFKCNNVVTNTNGIVMGIAGYYNIRDSVTTLNTWTKISGIFTSGTVGASSIIVDINSTNSVNDTFNMRNFVLIDLTLMFGAGNEPSTAAEVEAMFPTDFYPYNAGTLLSAGVTEVESVGKNLADPSIFFGVVTGATYSDGVWTTHTSALLTSFNWNSSNHSPILYGEKITISFDVKLVSGQTSSDIFYGILDPVTLQTIEGSPAIHMTENWQHTTTTLTNGVNGAKVYFFYSSGKNVNIKNFQIEESATETAYSPYQKIDYPIPTAIRNLEGYGWSAGSVYNYIDFERKVFVKNVGKVVLDGTQSIGLVNWAAREDSSAWAYYSSVIPSKPAPHIGAKANLICAELPTVTYAQIAGNSVGIANGDSATYGLFVRVADTSLTTASAINAYLSANPITVYYELATPQEIDISEYLTDDNLIQVESGGTLTFPNSNGAGYRLPVPSEEEYMIDLQEALS